MSFKEKIVVGLMSGTSSDGVDAALVKISGSGLKTRVELIDFETYPYPKEVKEMAIAVANSAKSSLDLICCFNFKLGDIFAEAVQNILNKAGVKHDRVSFIGSHGHTIRHLPEGAPGSHDKIPSTLQIGEPSVIAERTGITTIADFRPRDIAAGGLGAPLAPFGHFLLFSKKNKSRIIHNIGGISNLTYLPKNGNIDDVIAFDTGPGNMLIDGLVIKLTQGEKQYDKNGEWAARGKINEDILSMMMAHPFIKKSPPKATGREEFGEFYLKEILLKASQLKISGDDLMATITTFTSESIILNYEEHVFKSGLPSEIIFCGGGAQNIFLMNTIKNKLPGLTISTTEKHGIPPDALESVVFAILANETFHGNISNLPSVTGAKKKVILGKIIPG
jgi:anhydro-N-acetylmuramic acid kinase